MINYKMALIIGIILAIIPIDIISIAYAIKYFFDVKLNYLPPLTFSILCVQASAIVFFGLWYSSMQ